MKKLNIFNALLLCLCLFTLTGCQSGASQSTPAAPAISITTGDIFFNNSSTVPNVTIRNTSSTAETFSPTISNATGITLNDPNNCVSMSLAPGSTCTFTLSATANATTTANNPATLTVVASANSQTATSSASISLASPQVTINGGDPIELTSANSYTQVAPVTLTGGFNLQGTTVDTSALPSGTALTANTCSGATLSQSSPCSITVHSNTVVVGSGTVGISGSNLTTAETQTVAVDTASLTVQSPRTHLSAMSGTFSNPVGNSDVTINTITTAGSGSNPLTSGQMNIMTVNPDTHNATNLCTTGQILAAGSSCKVWVRVTNGADITADQTSATPQTGTLTLGTSVGTYTLNLSVTTDLYAEGSSATRKYVSGTTWTSIQIGGAGNNDYSTYKTSLDVLLGGIDNGKVGYYNGTSTVGSLGASVPGDILTVGSLSGGSNGGNNEYIFASDGVGSSQTLDITNGYGGSWANVTGNVGYLSANMPNGTLYTGGTFLFTSTNGTSSSAFSPSPASDGIVDTALLGGTPYIAGGTSIDTGNIQYFNGSIWVAALSNTAITGMVNWNSTLYAVGQSGIYKLTTLPGTFTLVSTTEQDDSYGFIATTNALYMMQSAPTVQRCTGTGATVTCTSLGNPGIGQVNYGSKSIVVAPTLILSRP